MSTKPFILLSTLYTLLQVISGSGFLEIQILEVWNEEGKLWDGRCCGIDCPGSCHTFFRLCLKEYQPSLGNLSLCSFGNVTSPVLGINSFNHPPTETQSKSTLVLPFTFSWTRSFTLILQVYHVPNGTTPGVGWNDDEVDVIDEAWYSGIVLPSFEWHTLLHSGRWIRIAYRLRVRCAEHYYNWTCTEFCRPREDKFGHYNCDTIGNKICLPGWKGTNCDIAICKEGCHPIHGKCDIPGDCECRPGWKGELCHQCTPYPGCKHGYCNGSSWQCICHTNWGGILCDQDLNYCGTHEPCQNAGICENTAPDQYLCRCPDGFSGLNCEVIENPCMTEPCLNEGICSHHNDTFYCTCQPGYTSKTCESNIDECSSFPCYNGATCIDLIDQYQCQCPPNWEGDRCQYDVDECTSNICVNFYSCENLAGDYTCKCQEGWSGKNCTVNVNDCLGQCRNGATCIDLINNYHCACSLGFTGRDCETNIDDCSSSPCLNNGECVDTINGFSCICPMQFSGELCENEYNHCSPSPCRNGSQCFNTLMDYYCVCSNEWQGKNCTVPKFQDKTICDHNICLNGGTCIASLSGHSCICDERFKGEHCEERVNLCLSMPCHNGAKCHDGIDWFMCECAPGFIGPDCRINVNECSSNPCYEGSTCIDDINGFRCICPPNKTGPTCQKDIMSIAHNKGSCKWNKSLIKNGSEWNDGCNICHCKNSRVTCTDVWCGLVNCFDKNNKCNHNQVCVGLPEESCLSEECADWGECRDLIGGKILGEPSYPSPQYCWPNRPASFSRSCAILNINFTPSLMPKGVNTESFCRELRSLLLERSVPYQNAIILCGLKDRVNNSMEVTVWIGEQNHEINEFKRLLTEQILNKKNQFTILRSVFEVNGRTSQVIEETGKSFYVAGSISGLLMMVVIFSLLVFHKEKCSELIANNRIHHEIEISNNNQNEENIKCYTNPIKEDWKCRELSLQVSVFRPATPSSSYAVSPTKQLTTGEDKGYTKVLQKIQNAGVESNQNSSVDCKWINLDIASSVQRTLVNAKENSEATTMFV